MVIIEWQSTWRGQKDIKETKIPVIYGLVYSSYCDSYCREDMYLYHTINFMWIYGVSGIQYVHVIY